jgi:hypothetical protein
MIRNMSNNRFGRFLVCYGLGCFVVAALIPLATYFSMLLTAWSAIPLDEASGALSVIGYVVVCLFGIPVVWLVLIAQSILWTPALYFAANRGLWTGIAVTASAPLAALMLYRLGLVSTQEHLHRLTVLGVTKLEPWAFEMIALTLTTASFFACTELVRRTYSAPS